MIKAIEHMLTPMLQATIVMILTKRFISFEMGVSFTLSPDAKPVITFLMLNLTPNENQKIH